MENAAEALKMAFAVFVFVIALTLVFSVISQARATANSVFALHDRDVAFYDELEESTNLSSHINGTEHRIVDWSTVVPTIYRYKIENYGVTIIDNNQIVARFSEKTENVAENYSKNKGTNISKEHADYLNDNILKTIGITTENISYDDSDNEIGNTLYKLFKNLYNLNEANQLFGALWLNNDDYMADRLDADVGDQGKVVSFSSGKHKGLNLGGTKSKTNGKLYKEEKFTEYFVTVPAQNENDDDTFEIIYVVNRN